VWVFGSHKCLYAENLDVIPRCGAILRTGSGTDNIPVTEATALGIVVANTPQAISDTVADHTIALLFAVVRQIVVQDRAVRAGIWDRHHAWPNFHFRGQTLGLWGFGHIAKLVARKMAGFEMNIISHDPFVPVEMMQTVNVQSVTLDDLLSRSDFLSIHIPLTHSTFHLIDAARMRQMKRTSILINTSRGSIVDEVALLEALKNGIIAAAGLDVLEEEPTRMDNPLLQLDNIVITPHIAAFSDQFPNNFWQYSVETIIDLAEGYLPRSYVNMDVEPRWKLRPKLTS
jgi:D-3-phosphoglycerate dehydrogenase